MWFTSKKTEMPSAKTALAGRAEGMAVPDAHYVNGNRLEPPFPEGLELAMFGMGCFWGASAACSTTEARSVATATTSEYNDSDL